MTTYGVVYRLENVNAPSARGSEGLRITFTYVASRSDGTGFIRTPRSWVFQYPSIDGFLFERLGASETRGLFGGVANDRQKMYSEVSERAIGEVLTATACEIVDTISNTSSTIFIFGPALPKAVGRLASLRIPSHTNVVWVCSTPGLEWIAERANEVLIVPQYPSQPELAEGWEDEPLIVGRAYRPTEEAAVCTLQCLQLWSAVRPSHAASLWAEARFLASLLTMKGSDGEARRDTLDECSGGVWLPREFHLAAGKIIDHISDPYSGEPEESWRDLTPEFQPAPHMATPVEERSVDLPGWCFEWDRG